MLDSFWQIQDFCARTKMQLGELIQFWRRVKGMSLREASHDMGVSLDVLFRFENGHAIDGTRLSRILAWSLKEIKRGKAVRK